jgi:hypothetical protein
MPVAMIVAALIYLLWLPLLMQHNQDCICVMLPKVCKASSVSTVILAVFAEMPATIIMAALIILALVTLIDATQSELYLCHVAQGMQGKLSKHCHSR